MAQIKLAWLICDMLGITSLVLGVMANLNNVRSTILFFVALIYLMFRMYFYVIKQKQTIRQNEIDLWHKETDKKERINKMKKDERNSN